MIQHVRPFGEEVGSLINHLLSADVQRTYCSVGGVSVNKCCFSHCFQSHSVKYPSPGSWWNADSITFGYKMSLLSKTPIISNSNHTLFPLQALGHKENLDFKEVIFIKIEIQLTHNIFLIVGYNIMIWCMYIFWTDYHNKSS